VYPQISDNTRHITATFHNRIFRSHQLATAAAGTDHMNEYKELHHIGPFIHTSHEQSQSPLFGLLPAEIRDIIYSYTFADYEDLEDLYDFNTCYRRPGHFGPRKSHTALLQTCQVIYNNCWYMPWTSAQQTFFLAWNGRRPPMTRTTEELESAVRLIESLHHPDVPARAKEIANVQVFAQLCELEDGGPLSKILDVEHFMPRSITITVRHTDIWSWEDDSPISMYGSQWVCNCRFPASVTNICFQLESLERKKEQVDSIMAQIREGWYFTRTDGAHLVPSVTGSSSEIWTGSSTWEHERWVRDEDDGEPGKIRYHIASLCFTPADMTDIESRTAREKRTLCDGLDVPREIADRTRAVRRLPPLNVVDMEQAGVTSDTPASEAIRMVREFHNQDPGEDEGEDEDGYVDGYVYAEQDTDEETD